jgi:hypothetical protein
MKSFEDQTEAILGRHLDQDFCVFPMSDSQQPVSQIEAIGHHLEINYPLEFQTHVSGRFPGIFVEVKEEIWPRPKMYAVGPFWSFLYALHTFTPDFVSEPWMRLDSAAAKFREDTGFHAAPVLKIVGDADVYCVDSRGKLVQFNHETQELKSVELSFWELFEREIRELRVRKDRKKGKT